MIKLNNVKNKGIGYIFFKFLSDRFHDYIFYRKVKYTGTENIDTSKPNLIGPNHQNALMDPMALLASRRSGSPVFLARSDIFTSDFLGNLFVSMKILPVYRIRDGKDKLAKNEEIFNLSVEVLEESKDLVIFPEAQHTDKRSILPLKKGLMRIAFHTAEKNNFDIDLQIVPVGIYYENYTNYRSKVLVNYGKPLSIRDYKESHAENPKSVLIQLRNDLKERMIPLAIHIKNKEHYNFFEEARYIFDKTIADEENLNLKKIDEKFKADKKIIAILDDFFENQPEKFEVIRAKTEEYTDKLKKRKIKDYLFEKPVSFIRNLLATFAWLLMLPLNILGFVNFAIPLGLPELLVKKFKDTQFHSSVRYVVSLFFPFIWGLIGFGIIWAITKTWWIGLAFFLIQYPFMPAWFEIRKFHKKLMGKWRFIFAKEEVKELKTSRNELIELFKNIK